MSQNLVLRECPSFRCPDVEVLRAKMRPNSWRNFAQDGTNWRPSCQPFTLSTKMTKSQGCHSREFSFFPSSLLIYDFLRLRFGDSSSRYIRYALERRIKLMPYIMTQMKLANTNDGVPLIRCQKSWDPLLLQQLLNLFSILSFFLPSLPFLFLLLLQLPIKIKR